MKETKELTLFLYGWFSQVFSRSLFPDLSYRDICSQTFHRLNMKTLVYGPDGRLLSLRVQRLRNTWLGDHAAPAH